jgi:hypothetical protein
VKEEVPLEAYVEKKAAPARARKRGTEANKAAQQRYRERKKQQVLGMEKELGEMRARLEDMEALKKRNEYLEGLNATLQEQMVDKELELERLRSRSVGQVGSVPVELQHSLTLGQVAGSKSTQEGRGSPKVDLCTATAHGSGDGGCAPGTDSKDNVAMHCANLEMDRLENKPVSNGVELNDAFTRQIEEIKANLAKHKVSTEHDPREGDVALSLTKEAVDELWGIIMKTCRVCYQCLRLSGPEVNKMIGAWHGERHGKDTGGHDGKNRWLLALDAMNLRQDQKKDLLLLRSRHLDNMKKIYEERQRLNMFAISKMVGAPEDVPEDATIEGKIHSISTGTSLGLSRINASLSDALDKIKANLRKEQKAVMSLNCTTLTQILDCVQAARYMIWVFPMHCDALALANALHQKECSASASADGST